MEIVDDALKEKEEMDVWNPEGEPMLSPTPTPEGEETIAPAPTEEPEEDGSDDVGQGVSGEIGTEENETGGAGAPDAPSGTPTPIPEPTPPTGWIEYDDDWWDAQMGESIGGYDDFYE